MISSEKTEQVSASLFAVHRDLITPKKDSKANTGKFSYTYLSLPALIEHLRPKLKEAQLYVTQEVRGGQGFAEVYTTVWHFSGQFIEFGPARVPYTGEAQQAGAAITYCRRYALAAVFNLAADEDTDAAASPPVRAAAAALGVGPSRPQGITVYGTRAGPADLGEGSNGPAPATSGQWANLLASVDGKPKVALALINENAGTNYGTYAQAKQEATKAELDKALA